jgi:hypothetical protein
MDAYHRLPMVLVIKSVMLAVTHHGPLTQRYRYLFDRLLYCTYVN